LNSKLYKNSSNKIISGVCSGIAEAIQIDPTIVRIIAAALCIYWPISVLIYLLLAIILPEKPYGMKSSDSSASEDETEQKQHQESSNTQQPFRTKPPASGSTAIVFAIILICSGIGLFVTRVIFNYAIGFSDFITFVTLGIGIYLIVSGIVESDDAHSQRTTKIVAGTVIVLFCLLWIFNIFGFNLLSVNDLFGSIRYLWPLLIIAIGINVLLPTRKASAIIWLGLIVVIVIYTIFHGSLFFNPFNLVHI